MFDDVATEMYTKAHGEEPAENIQIRPFGLREASHMRQLDPADIDRLVLLPGCWLGALRGWDDRCASGE